MSVPTVKTKNGDVFSLGRIKPKVKPQCLAFCNYLIHSPCQAAYPDVVDYSPKAAQALANIYLNNQYGDCVIAGEAHNIGVRTGNQSGTPAIFSDDDIFTTYQAACGPGDNGCLITDVLNYQKTVGFPGGHKIAGYVSVDNANQAEVRAAIYLFGCITLGINLPGSWANNASPGFVWDDTSDGAVGGHEVVCMGYNSKGVITATWGMLGLITWAGLADKNIVTECYAAIGPDWVDVNKPAPNGLDLASLQSDLQALGGGTVPPLPDPVPPSPPPPGPVPPPPPPPLPPPGPVLPPLTPAEIMLLIEEIFTWIKNLDTTSKFGQAVSQLTPGQLLALLEAILAAIQQFFPLAA